MEGWRNHLFPPEHLRELIEQVSCERMAICCECKWHSKYISSLRPDDHCTNCGCTLSAKTKCLSCECPLPIPKWNAVISQEEEDEIESGT